MRNSAQEQFAARGRYTVIPRTLVFLREGADVLLLKGAPTKRLWANRYNGLGGHVEAGETIVAAALREVWEEAGIAPERITNFVLRALINVEGTPTGVLLCVFVGEVHGRAVLDSAEGTVEWAPVARLAEYDLVDGDRLLPGLLPEQPVRYGHLRYDAAGDVSAFALV
ncbi:MAG: NUDIX domain-containing protein [Thermomicrobiales bacterium]|jgi:8-oxo-dGTP diphosphatase|nr:NUDIX domain-containing protein [Thermomicrobiales bacterium]